MAHAYKKAHYSMSSMKATQQFDVGHCFLVYSQLLLGPSTELAYHKWPLESRYSVYHGHIIVKESVNSSQWIHDIFPGSI